MFGMQESQTGCYKANSHRSNRRRQTRTITRLWYVHDHTMKCRQMPTDIGNTLIRHSVCWHLSVQCELAYPGTACLIPCLILSVCALETPLGDRYPWQQHWQESIQPHRGIADGQNLSLSVWNSHKNEHSVIHTPKPVWLTFSLYGLIF